MKLCLDACVAVASERPKEPRHAASRARIDRVLAGTDSIIAPALFVVEVAASLARAGVDPKVIGAYVDSLVARAELIFVGPKRSIHIAQLAIRTQLRASDAAYAWVAGFAKVPLVTLDAELLTRAGAVCTVEQP